MHALRLQLSTRDIESTTRSASSMRWSFDNRMRRESNAFLRVMPGLRVERVDTTSFRRDGEKLESVMKLKVRLVLKKPSWIRLLRMSRRVEKSPEFPAAVARSS